MSQAYPSLDRAAVIAAIVNKFFADRWYRRLTPDLVKLLGGGDLLPADLAEALEVAGIAVEPATDYHRGWILWKDGDEPAGQMGLL